VLRRRTTKLAAAVCSVLASFSVFLRPLRPTRALPAIIWHRFQAETILLLAPDEKRPRPVGPLTHNGLGSWARPRRPRSTVFDPGGCEIFWEIRKTRPLYLQSPDQGLVDHCTEYFAPRTFLPLALEARPGPQFGWGNPATRFGAQRPSSQPSKDTAVTADKVPLADLAQ
jgi:hypothetical protein